MTDTLNSSAPHIYNAVIVRRSRGLGRAGELHRRARRNPRGRLLFKGPNNDAGDGVWVCTPGTWPLSIPRDEFCHFIAGRATYTRDNGEVIEVRPGTCVHFHRGLDRHLHRP